MLQGESAMSSTRRIAISAILAGQLLLISTYVLAFGRPATPDEIKLWDIDIRPDGLGLPAGNGTVAEGKLIYEDNCAACHGPDGQGGIKDPLVGGMGTLASDKPIKTVGSYWPYSTTLFDYIRRAMPYQAPGTLGDNDTYALTAYILSLNGILPNDAALNAETLAKVEMPNRGGFIPDPEYRTIKNSR